MTDNEYWSWKPTKTVAQDILASLEYFLSTVLERALKKRNEVFTCSKHSNLNDALIRAAVISTSHTACMIYSEI